MKRPPVEAAGLEPWHRPANLQPMPSGRLLRLLLFALPLLLGAAAGVRHTRAPAGWPAAASWPAAGAAISAPRQSLPVPVHNEATCAFCQAAIFPPCAPQPTDVSLGAVGLVRHERPVLEARVPHGTSHRSASSRAPPQLRDA